MMLHEFIAVHLEDILARARDRAGRRLSPPGSSRAPDHGVPLFLTQLSETLRFEATARPCSTEAIGSTAARYGAELLAAGFNVAEVVRRYGDICQAITEIAREQHAQIAVDEFHTLNRCLDTAVAEAVAEYTRLTAQRRSEEEAERLGRAAHELRDLLNGALLAFHALEHGTAATKGDPGAVLGRSLTGLRDLVSHMVSEVRLAAVKPRSRRLAVATFIDEIATTAVLHSEHRGIHLSVAPVDAALAVNGDPQLLTSAVMNLVHNAFKHTPCGGTVSLRAYAHGNSLFVDIQDQCGGIPPTAGDLFEPFGVRGGGDRSGLGLGLSIARQAARAHGGDIRLRNMPGKCCVFTIEVPLAAQPERVLQRA